jgi:hypothetical protein
MQLFGVPVEFILFALTLVGVALLHHYTLYVALAGLAVITGYKLAFTGFKFGAGFAGLGLHLQHEWVILANLFLLLTGFALLSRHFEASRVPDEMPAFLPDDWKGGLVLIVAASNAGGSGSVVGDTTTTMMWIDGVSPLSVLHAYVAAGTALLIFGIPAARQQQRFSPIVKQAPKSLHIEWTRLFIVAAILICAVAVNVIANLKFPALLDAVPLIGLAVWTVILATAPLRRPDWEILPETAKGTIFLLALVVCASMMPVEELPAPSWPTALGLGFISAVFDNIPLTALALNQGGYDWGFLAYAVGFGGSMVWFGSSAGVALANMYGEAKSVGLWLRHGWHVAVAYVIGFFVMLAILGWNPDSPHRKRADLHGIEASFGMTA